MKAIKESPDLIKVISNQASYFKSQQSKKMEYRTEDFKLGCFHGKLQPENPKSEAKMRNDIFLIGHLGLVLSRRETLEIKIVSNEMPLEKGKSRGRCIDLFGIDKDWNAYIIELKLDKTNEKLEKVINQVTAYAEIFEQLKNDIALEMQTKLYYKNFVFSKHTRKVIVVHNNFYAPQNNPKKYIDDKSLFICSFSNKKSIQNLEEINLLEKNNTGILRLAIKNKL